jgi:hypothetical protein
MTVQVRRRSDDALVRATVTLSAGRTLTVNPVNNLAPDTQYRVTLHGGTRAIRDINGLPLVTIAWNFTSGPI